MLSCRFFVEMMFGSALLVGWALLETTHAQNESTEESTVKNTELPTAIQDRAYSAALPLLSAVGRVESRVTSGQLPDGLGLHGGWIRGTPGEAGRFTFEITARDQLDQEALAVFAITVLPPRPPLTILDRNLPDCRACTPYCYGLRCSGGNPPYSWSVTGELPKGLELRDGRVTGMVLSGPAESNEHTFTVEVSDGVGAVDSRSCTLKVTSNPDASLRLAKPVVNGRVVLPTALVDASYDASISLRGGYGRLSWTTNGEIPPGLQLLDGRLCGKTQMAGTWEFEVTVKDEIRQELTFLAELRITACPLQIATQALPIARIGDFYVTRILATGGQPPYQWNITGVPQWASCSANAIAGTPPDINTIGTTALSATVTDSSGDRYGPVELVIHVKENPDFAVPEITTTDFPLMRTNEPYSATLIIRGGMPPYRVALLSGDLPDGLELEVDGQLAGKTVQSGDWPLRLQVIDRLQQQSQAAEILLRVRSAGNEHLRLGGPFAVTGTVGERLEYKIPVAGGVLPYTFSMQPQELPPGLELDGCTGMLAGAPACEGVWSLSLAVRDGLVPPSEATGVVKVTVVDGVRSKPATLRRGFIVWLLAIFVLAESGIIAVMTRGVWISPVRRWLRLAGNAPPD